jgi:hypothetical protein
VESVASGLKSVTANRRRQYWNSPIYLFFPTRRMMVHRDANRRCQNAYRRDAVWQMTTGDGLAVFAEEKITQRELVVHVFCPLDEKRAAGSVELARRVLDRAADALGTTQPVPGYPDRLPESIEDFPGTVEPAAMSRHPERPVQLMARKARDDMLLLSVLITPEGRQGWTDAEQLWTRVLSGLPPEPVLGIRRLYLAKVPDDVTDLALAGVWPRPAAVTQDGRCAVWPMEPPGSPLDRKVAVLARVCDDDALSSFAWWHGNHEIPPLVRLLMNSVRIRNQRMVWDNGSHTRQFRSDTEHELDLLFQEKDAGRRQSIADRLRELAADIGSADTRLAEMRRTVEICLANAVSAVDWRDGPEVAGTLPEEEIQLGRRLRRAVADDRFYLQAIGRRATIYREYDRIPATPAPERLSVPLLRLGFVADIVSYGRRPAADTDLLRRRFNELCHAVLDRMGTDRGTRVIQTEGDMTIGLFPTDTQLPVALPGLMTTMALLLDADNRRYTDKLALRMAVGAGLAARTENGFSGKLVTNLARLVDCEQVREAAKSGRPLAVIVEDGLYQQVVAAGYPMPPGVEFRQVHVSKKEYSELGWIWGRAGP